MSAANKQPQELIACAEFALANAKQRGVDQAEVNLETTLGYTVNVRNGDVETIEHHRDQGLSITLYCAARKGNATVTDLSEQSIRDAVAAAHATTRYTSQDQHAGLCDPALLSTDIPNLQLAHDWDLSIEDAIEIGIACEAEMFATDQKVTNSEGASIATVKQVNCYANSHDFVHAYTQTTHSISALAIASENGEMQRDYWYTLSRRASDLDDPLAVARKAAMRAVRRLQPQKITTTKAPILFDAPVARSLVKSFIAAISGSVLYNKMSFLYDSLDKQVFPTFIRVYEQPHLLAAIGSAPIDGDGIVTRANTIVHDGTLSSYVLDNYAARKLGLETTANAGGVHNLQFVSASPVSQDDLLKKMGSGLFLTELIGQGVNLVTGDYSRGVSGFWVENGTIQYPIEQATIAGNLRDMFKGIVQVGSDIDQRGSIHSGSILLDEMTLASH